MSDEKMTVVDAQVAPLSHQLEIECAVLNSLEIPINVSALISRLTHMAKMATDLESQNETLTAALAGLKAENERLTRAVQGRDDEIEIYKALVQKVKAEREAERADAERYRFLFDDPEDEWTVKQYIDSNNDCIYLDKEDCDSAIDDAREGVSREE